MSSARLAIMVNVLIPMAWLSCCLIGIPMGTPCPDPKPIQQGMTKDEVRAILGEPQNVDARETETSWFYQCKSFWPYPPISVRFDENERVSHVFVLD